MDETKAIARLPHLDIEIRHRRLPEEQAEQLAISLKATPSFEAFAEFLERPGPCPWLALQPWLLWAKLAQATWQPWLAASRAALAAAGPPTPADDRQSQPQGPPQAADVGGDILEIGARPHRNLAPRVAGAP